MRKRPHILALGCVVAVSSALGQSCDWKALFADLTSDDAAVSERARKKAFGEVIPRIESEDASSLDRDLVEIIKMFREGPAVRLQASGLLAALAMHRPDGTTALARAVPALMTLSYDDNFRVRRNAVVAIANLKPRIPPSAIAWLVTRVHEDDEGAAEAALYGLARSAKESSAATQTLAEALSQNATVRVRRAALTAVGYERIALPAIILGLRGNLNDANQEMVKEAIRTASRLGPAAAELSSDLQRIVERGDNELAPAAAEALSRVRK